MDPSDSYHLDTNSSPADPPSLQGTLPSPAPRLVRPWFFKPRKSRYGLEDDRKKERRFNSLHWSQQENTKYVEFLRDFLDLINSNTLEKRKYHLNRMLSKHIGSRSPVQCRSHHQKMIKAFKTPEAIIQHFLNTPSHNPENTTTLTHPASSPIPELEKSPLQTSYGTSTDDFAYPEEEKRGNLGTEGMMCDGEFSLWDVLTDNHQEFQFIDLL